MPSPISNRCRQVIVCELGFINVTFFVLIMPNKVLIRKYFSKIVVQGERWIQSLMYKNARINRSRINSSYTFNHCNFDHYFAITYYCYKIYLAQMNQFVMVVKTFFGFEFRVTVFARQDGLWIEILFSVVILQTGIGSELFQAVRTFKVFLKQMSCRVVIVSPFFGPISLEITIKWVFTVIRL